MNAYAMRTKFGFSLVTNNKDDVKQYLGNTVFPIVKVKITKDERGNYFLFEKNDGKIYVCDNSVIFNLTTAGKIGKVSKAKIEER